MAMYSPAPFPRRPKQSNLFTEIRYKLQLSYYRYEINTGQYVMSAGEKMAFNLIILSTLVFLFSAICYYLPQSVVLSIRRLAFYVTGTPRATSAVGSRVPDLAEGILCRANDAAVILGEGGMSVVNASRTLLP